MQVFSYTMLMTQCLYLETCLSSRLLSIVLWLRMTHQVPMLSQNACCGWGAWCQSLSFGTSPFSNSAQFSHSVMSDSLQPHEPQHTRPPCPSPTPGVDPNSCPLSCWCHPTISSSVIPFSSHPQSFPASRSFPVSQLFTSGGQSIAVSASTSVLPMNIQEGFPLGWTGWISLLSKGLSRVFSNIIQQFKSINYSVLSFLYSPTITSLHDYWKNHSLDEMDLCW